MRHSSLRELIMVAARGAFLMFLPLVLAFHGGTQSATQPSLENLLLGIAAFYALGVIIRREHFSMEPGLIVAVGALLTLGWLSACQAASVFDRGLRVFLPITPAPWWPWGTVDEAISTDTMRRITGCLAALLMARDLGAHAGWRQLALALMACCGVAAATFGMVHQLYGDIGNYWGTAGTKLFRDTVFGFFWYHGNAGAFLNLCWPLLAMKLWRDISGPDPKGLAQQMRRALLVLALLLIVGAIWVNHSRAAQAIFLMQVVAGGLLLLTGGKGTLLPLASRRAKLIWTAAIATALLVLAFAFGLDQSLEKWNRFAEGGMAADGRWAVLRTCSRWLGEVPLLGYGPGTFSAVFVVKTTGMTDSPAGYWEFAHNDYLQTLFEWGWLGLALALGMGLRILLVIGRKLLRSSDSPAGRMRRTVLAAISISLFSVAAHAIVDFPLQIFAIQLYAATLAGIGLSVNRAAPVHSSGR